MIKHTQFLSQRARGKQLFHQLSDLFFALRSRDDYNFENSIKWKFHYFY